MKKKKIVIFALTALSATMLSTAIACSTDSQPDGHSHNWSIKSSADKHWYECSCGEKQGEASHSDANSDGKCDACQYVLEDNRTEYKVTFNIKGHGTAPEDQNVKEGNNANKPADPTDVNYNFKGWYSDEDCTAPYDFNSAVSGNVTLYAKWEVKIPEAPVLVTVTFDANGHGTAPASQEVEEGGTVTMPSDPTDDHYDFKGWYIDADCLTPFDFENDTVSTATTIYAKWEAKTFTVTFYDVENIGDMPEALSVKYGETATAPATAPTASGYNFLGWYSDIACTKEFDFENAVIEKDTTIYAQWEAVSEEGRVKVTFNLGEVAGIANAPRPQSIEENTTATAPATNPTATHYVFDGWYTDGTFATPFDFTQPVTADTTVYAHWVGKMYTVTFDLNGQSVTVNSQSVRYNETATRPANPSVSGLRFLGWYKEAECKNAYDFNSAISGNTTVYAKWSGPLGSIDNPIQISTAGENLSKNHESNVLYYTFANAGVRYSLSISGIMAPNCSFTTSLDGYKAVYGKDGVANFLNFNLVRGEEIIIKLDRSAVSKTADIGLKVTEVTDEALPASGWISGKFYSANRNYALEFSRDFGSGTNKYLKFNGSTCSYSYIGGSVDTATFTYRDSEYTLTQTMGGYHIDFKGVYGIPMSLDLSPVHAIADISEFSGVYASNSGYHGYTNILIYESGNGKYSNNYSKDSWAFDNEALYDEDLHRLMVTTDSGTMGISLITDAKGKVIGLNVFDPSDGYNEIIIYTRVGDAGKEIPEKLPLSDNLELAGATLGIVNEFGYQKWADNTSLVITDYDNDTNIYTVTKDDKTYTLEIEGTDAETVVKIYDEEHATLVDTLTKKVVVYPDLKLDGTNNAVSSGNSNVKNKIALFNVPSGGVYTFSANNQYPVYIYTNYIEDPNSYVYVDYNKAVEVTISEGATFGVSFVEYGASFSLNFTMKEKVIDPGVPDGTQNNPFKINGEGNVTLEKVDGNDYYVTFTATEAGTYHISAFFNYLGSTLYRVNFKVDGVQNGYVAASYYWGTVYTDGVEAGNDYYAENHATITVTAGQKVEIVLTTKGGNEASNVIVNVEKA
ncbi:MAG: InlB B-repeat-containing protein [Clostridia bacterium]|nr:InlB B-repeat-containing protein [Clostridia bacterium]